MEMTFQVPGVPRGKGRPRFSGGRAYTDGETRAYEKKIADCYWISRGPVRWPEGTFFEVEIIAYLPIPKSASKAQRAAMELGMVLPSRKPDVDNIEKAVLDALNGVAYPDDSRVHKCSCAKYYGAVPRLEITLRTAAPSEIL